MQQYNLHLFVMWAGDIFKVSYLSHFVLKYEYHLCNSVIRAFFNHYNPSKFCQIVTNFHNFFNWFSTRFSFIQHISCLLPVWKLKRVSHHTSKKGTLDCEIAVTICGATRSSSKTLEQKQHGASKNYKIDWLSCSHLATDNISEQLSKHIFLQNAVKASW